jgi:hypothetical protein
MKERFSSGIGYDPVERANRRKAKLEGQQNGRMRWYEGRSGDLNESPAAWQKARSALKQPRQRKLPATGPQNAARAGIFGKAHIAAVCAGRYLPLCGPSDISRELRCPVK